MASIETPVLSISYNQPLSVIALTLGKVFTIFVQKIYNELDQV